MEPPPHFNNHPPCTSGTARKNRRQSNFAVRRTGALTNSFSGSRRSKHLDLRVARKGTSWRAGEWPLEDADCSETLPECVSKALAI